MALPQLLSATRQPLPTAGAPQWQRLPLAMQHQLQTQWCWSAVATSVSLFYNVGSGWTQCTLVNAELGQTTCCQNGASSQCNQPWYLDRALRRTGNLNTVAGGRCSFDVVQREVDGRRPLGTRIGWQGGGGHFVALDGYAAVGGQFVSVQDPWYGPSDYAYDKFATAYHGTGSWTHTYYTQP